MRQVSREMNPSPPSGRPRYNLDDYIKQKDPNEEGDEKSEEKRKKFIPL